MRLPKKPHSFNTKLNVIYGQANKHRAKTPFVDHVFIQITFIAKEENTGSAEILYSILDLNQN